MEENQEMEKECCEPVNDLNYVREETPMVSVAMTSYNQEKFIAEAIEGVLMQKTNFPFELVIGEDCSTDRTREICLDYQKRYPDQIRLILHEKNVGLRKNNLSVWTSCRGKYIAYCEGDDYWTDPFKLQKQIDFLEKNPEFSSCFHQVEVKHEGKSDEKTFFVKNLKKNEFDFDEINESWFVPTCSFVFRNFLKDNPTHPFFSSRLFHSDRPLMAFAAKVGKFFYIDEVMGCFRRHETNMSKIGQTDRMYFEGALAYEKLIKLYPENKIKLSEQVVKWALWASKAAFLKKAFLASLRYNLVAFFSIRSVYGLKTYFRFSYNILKGKEVW